MFTEDLTQIALSQFYPNPATKGAVWLNLDVAEGAAADVEVFDVRGALVSSRAYVLNAGRNRVHVDTDGLAVGAHFPKISVGEKVLYRQFVVVR